MTAIDPVAAEAATRETPIEAKEGWAHVGCPTCGNVATVPLEAGESLPWCVHGNTAYSWRAPHPQTQAGPSPWTQMVRVRVAVIRD